jgi:serine/threonine protein kinase
MGNIVMTKDSNLQNAVYDPDKIAIRPDHPMNPNSIFPVLRMTNRILSLKMKKGAAGDISRSHFIFSKLLAEGQFGPVYLVEKLPDKEKMVMKIISKCKAYNRRCVDTVINEFQVLTQLMHPFMCNLKYAF